MIFPKFFLLLLFVLTAASLQADVQPDHLKMIQKEGLLRVCIQDEYPTITFVNRKTQKIEGFDAEMARELAKDLSVKVQFIDSSPTRIAAQLHRNHCDVAMFALTISPELSKQVRFTKPVLISDFYGITTHFNRRIKSWNDIDKSGTVVAVLRGSLHEQVLKQRFSNARIEVQDSLIASEYEVESGRVDLLVTDYHNTRVLLNSKDWARLVTPPVILNRSVHAYASDLYDEIWGEALDKFVKDVKRDGRLLNAARRYDIESMAVTR
jgi:ABC-type amino acid transport substrate-binding protein